MKYKADWFFLVGALYCAFAVVFCSVNARWTLALVDVMDLAIVCAGWSWYRNTKRRTCG